MIRLLLLLYRRRTLRYALDRCRQMQADAAASAEHYESRLRRVEAEIVVEQMERRMPRVKW